MSDCPPVLNTVHYISVSGNLPVIRNAAAVKEYREKVGLSYFYSSIAHQGVPRYYYPLSIYIVFVL